jgi:ABC-2 type transport system permease protein
MTGFATFLRTFVRRDAWMVLWWALGTTLLYYSQAVSVDALYPTQAEFDRAAASMEGNAAFIAMAGPARALDTVGGQVAWQSTAFGAVLVGLMSMFLVGRHTRAEEESGRDELLRAAAVGRLASTAAAVTTALLANVVVGVLVGASLVAFGLAAADSWALGLGLTAVGWFFTGTAFVAAQLTASTRTAYAIAGAVIGVSYVLRAVGDVGNGLASWLSPIGWYQAMHAFSGLRWWPAGLLVLATAAAGTVGYRLFGSRDYGSGVLATRPGPPHAGNGLRSGLGLAWRLHRAAVAGWAGGMLLCGVAYGAIGQDVDSLIGDSDESREVFAQGGGGLVDGFFATSILMLAVICCGYAVSSALRPRGEEDSSHLEVLLATALSRRAWLGGHVTVTTLGTLATLAAAGAGLGLGYLAVTGDGSYAWQISWPVLAYAAPVLALSAIARLLFGVAPRLMVLAWLPLAFVAVVMLFGDILQLPQWLQDVSPFEHLALVPAESFAWTPVVVVGLVAVAVSAAGQLAFARRDVH